MMTHVWPCPSMMVRCNRRLVVTTILWINIGLNIAISASVCAFLRIALIDVVILFTDIFTLFSVAIFGIDRVLVFTFRGIELAAGVEYFPNNGFFRSIATFSLT